MVWLLPARRGRLKDVVQEQKEKGTKRNRERETGIEKRSQRKRERERTDRHCYRKRENPKKSEHRN